MCNECAGAHSLTQDFLGSSASAKTFTTRYLALRFPLLISSNTNPQTSSATNLMPPPQSTNTKKPKSASQTPIHQPRPVSTEIPEALNAAFGSGGKIYQKNRDADDSNWSRRVTPTGSGHHTPGGVGMGQTNSGSGSGHPRQPVRSGGALVIQEAKKAPPRVEGEVTFGGMSGDGSSSSARKGKGKETEKIWDVPKSKEVKLLEGIIKDLEKLQAGDEKLIRGSEALECFCQGMSFCCDVYDSRFC